MTEAQLQKAVIDYARTLGWRVAHFRTGMNSRGQYMTAVQGDGAGFPDLIMVRRKRLIFAELKQDGKYPSPNQREWIGALSLVDWAEVYIWKPKQWLDDTIINILEAA